MASPVDRHRDGLADPRVGEPLVVGREARVGDVRDVGLMKRSPNSASAEAMASGGRVSTMSTLPSCSVGVGRVHLGVDAVLQPIGLGRLVAGVVVVAGQGDTAPAPGTKALLGLERAVADRLLAEGRGVVEEGRRAAGRRRCSRRPSWATARTARTASTSKVRSSTTAQAAHLGRGRVAGHVAGLVGGSLQVVVPGDVSEEVRVLLGVGAVGGVVPRVDEGLRVHRRAVVERPAVLERDGPVLVVSSDSMDSATPVNSASPSSS